MKQTAETLCANNERTFNRYMMHKFKFAMFFFSPLCFIWFNAMQWVYWIKCRLRISSSDISFFWYAEKCHWSNIKLNFWQTIITIQVVSGSSMNWLVPHRQCMRQYTCLGRELPSLNCSYNLFNSMNINILSLSLVGKKNISCKYLGTVSLSTIFNVWACF